jgi:hypothetical protein
MLEISAITPPNKGWLVGKLDQEEIDFLWSAVDHHGSSVKSTLAGNISGSFELKDDGDWFLNKSLVPLLAAYADTFGDLGAEIPLTTPGIYHLSSFWVNFQSQGEFNPPHTHGGVYSFVIWLKNPVSWEDQLDLPMTKGSNSPSAATFQFYYQDILGGPGDVIYKMNKDAENRIVFFPASLRHLVFPFFGSEDTRISISGNISVKSNENP